MEVRQLYARVAGCKAEYRLENVTQRKKEIQRVHEAIRHAVPKLVEAVRADDGSRSERSVLSECHALLLVLREISDGLSLDTAFKEEKLPERGDDDVDRRVPHGIVLILAQCRAPLVQAIVPLAYAIGAGNESILVLSPSLTQTSALLYSLLLGAGVDLEATGILKPDSEKEWKTTVEVIADLGFDCLVVQDQADLGFITSTQFFSRNPTARVIDAGCALSVVILTRHGDVAKAAKDVANANFPSGHLLLLFVDEMELENFRVGFVRETHAISDLVGEWQRSPNYLQDKSFHTFREKGGDIWNLAGGRRALVGQANWKGLDNFPPVREAGQMSMYILPTTSMEVPLSVTPNLTSRMKQLSPPVIYIYGDSSEARYLSLFLESSLIFLQQIPAISSFLPAQHSLVAVAIKSLYSRPSPVYAGKGKVGSGTTIGVDALRNLIKADIMLPPKQIIGSRLGFFPQGALFGFSHLLLALGSITALAVWVGKWYFKTIS